MDFAPDARTRELADQLEAFLAERVYPAEPVLAEQVAAAAATVDRWRRPPVLRELQHEARARGLWNLFLPDAPDGTRHGAGLTNLQYAPLAELTGRSPHLAPAALNCAAPDTGNMELLALFGTPAQQERWLRPLLDATIRSAFLMTEPGVASSDASNVQTRIVRDGDHWVIDGRKWWSSGAMDPDCALFVVMGKTDPHGDRHHQQSMVLVPRDTPGVHVRRSTDVMGFDDAPHGGHGEVELVGARVPAENLLGPAGEGFAMAQARLGPGRIHHCMRLVGMGERAVELMCRRALARETFGRPLAQQGVVQHWIAESRVRLEQLRLLLLKTAWLMDTVGNRAAHTEIQAIKIATPSTVEWILDKAIQVHGAAGLSEDTPLAEWWSYARTLRIADGPDEVHRAALARAELRRHT